MEHLIERFCRWWFVPPQAPIERLPLGGKIAGLRDTFQDFGHFCYFEGSKDGFVAGAGAVFLALIVAVVIGLVIQKKGIFGVVLSIF